MALLDSKLPPWLAIWRRWLASEKRWIDGRSSKPFDCDVELSGFKQT